MIKISKMNKLTKEEIAKVFAMYLGADIFTNTGWSAGGYSAKHNDITLSNIEILTINTRFYLDDPENEKERKVSIILKQVANITREDAIELSELINGEKYPAGEKFKVVNDDGEVVVFSSEVIHTTIKDFGFRCRTTIYTDFMVQPIKDAISCRRRMMNFDEWQFLLNKGYAVPLYFSPGHWANGMNAIELGIGIDAKAIPSHP
jgi:hypothetical protein